MPRPTDRDFVALGPWPKGANNLAREDSVPGSSFRSGVNVDVYPGGKIRRRPGRTLVDPTPTTNLWSDGEFGLCTSIDDGRLFGFVPGAPLTLLYTGLRPEADIAYCAINDVVYVSDGVQALQVRPTDGRVRPWSVPTPAGQPTLAADAGGLDPGGYQVAVTYATAQGEESGTTQAATIDLPAGGGIRATLPAFAVPAFVAFINVYMTKPGGKELLFYDRYPVGALDVVLGNQALGRPLRTFGLEPLPAGNAAAMVGARLVVATGNMLVASESLNFGLANLATNYIPFAGDVDMLAPTAMGAVAEGAFVGAGSRTYFLAGPDILASVNRLSLAVGAQRGAPEYINGSDFGIDGMPPISMPVWVSKEGFVCVGMSDGTIKQLTNGVFALPLGERVTIAQRFNDGIQQIVTTLRSPMGTLAATSDSADTVLVRNGVVIP